TDVVGCLAHPCSFRRSASLASPAGREMPPKGTQRVQNGAFPEIENDGAAGAVKQTAGGALPMPMHIVPARSNRDASDSAVHFGQNDPKPHSRPTCFGSPKSPRYERASAWSGATAGRP